MQFDRLKGREFVTLLGTAAVAGPRGLLAQPASRRYLVGGLMPFPLATLARFVDTLGQLGFVEEQNLTIDPRGFSVPYDRLAVIAGELVEAKVDAIICAGDAAIIAAQAATSSIPIVAITDDMVGAGLVRSLARPGGNTTGVSLLAGDLDGKRQEVLFDFFPEGRRMAVLADTKTNAPSRLHELEDAAQVRGVTLSIHRVERDDQIGPAIESAKATGAVALNVLASPLLHGTRQSIITQSNALHLPAIYQWAETAHEGGLLAYGPRLSEPMVQLGKQLAKVLRGANPADLPVQQPTKFELVINQKTAKLLGLDFAPMLLARADELIE
jgi:putative tryptophan/tyrosine transport system substrate-binding protein